MRPSMTQGIDATVRASNAAKCSSCTIRGCAKFRHICWRRQPMLEGGPGQRLLDCDVLLGARGGAVVTRWHWPRGNRSVARWTLAGGHRCRRRPGVRQVAHRELLPSVTHRRSKYLNNRAENSHQSTRVRERVMKRFASPGQAQRFLFAFGSIRQHFRPRRHLISAPEWRTEMTNRFAVWNQIITAAAA